MSSFTESRIERLPYRSSEGRPLFAVRGVAGNGFFFDIGYEGSGLRVHVKEGFVTDLASDPTGILDLTGAALKAIKAIILHDMLCENTLFTRLTADAICLMAMEAEGTPLIWRELIFAAIRTNTSRARRNPDELVFEPEMPPY